MGTKKVGVLTFHVAHNYGAMLQAYALPTALRKMGYDAEVVDYRFPYIYEWGRSIDFKELLETKGLVKAVYRYTMNLLKGAYDPSNAYNKFNYFREHVMPCSNKIYRTIDEIDNMDYDALLFGSDQIWNENLTNGVSKEYFGQFECLDKTKRIAYAASTGSSDFYEKAKELSKSYLSKFDAIGTRELGLTNTLKERGFDAVHVLDPSLLLNKEDWMEMVNVTPNKLAVPDKYLLIYAFDEDERLYEVARQVAAEKNLKIVVIAYQKKACMEGMEVYTNCGPADFVNLIANAEFTITTSFHGTAFSILLHKDFRCVPHPKYRERTDSVLEMVGLERVNVANLDELLEPIEIDWEDVELSLNKEREKSLNFLKKALE